MRVENTFSGWACLLLGYGLEVGGVYSTGKF